MNNCTCIIPFYNEGPRITKVLDEVIKIKDIKEIICIDDGSTDNASTLVKKHYPQIRLVTLTKNIGKTEAISRVLNTAKGEYILLLDADLRNFNHREAEKAVTASRNYAIDMIILRRINAAWFIKLNRADTLLSGERILKKVDLQKVLEEYRPARFQLEFAINKYMMDNNKKVYWMPSSALNSYPIHKRKFLVGLYNVLSMQIDILSYIGLINFIKQQLFFCRERFV